MNYYVSKDQGKYNICCIVIIIISNDLSGTEMWFQTGPALHNLHRNVLHGHRPLLPHPSGALRHSHQYIIFIVWQRSEPMAFYCDGHITEMLVIGISEENQHTQKTVFDERKSQKHVCQQVVKAKKSKLNLIKSHTRMLQGKTMSSKNKFLQLPLMMSLFNQNITLTMCALSLVIPTKYWPITHKNLG